MSVNEQLQNGDQQVEWRMFLGKGGASRIQGGTPYAGCAWSASEGVFSEAVDDPMMDDAQRKV